MLYMRILMGNSIKQSNTNVKKIDPFLMSIRDTYAVGILCNDHTDMFYNRLNDFIARFTLGVVFQYIYYDMAYIYIYKNLNQPILIFYGLNIACNRNFLTNITNFIIHMEYDPTHYTYYRTLESIKITDFPFITEFNKKYFNEIIFTMFNINETIHKHLYWKLKDDLFNYYNTSRDTLVKVLVELIWIKYQFYVIDIDMDNIIKKDLYNAKSFSDNIFINIEIMQSYNNKFSNSHLEAFLLM